MGFLGNIFKNSKEANAYQISDHYRINENRVQKCNSALLTVFDFNSLIGPTRHDIQQAIINKWHASDNPLDILAVAIAYEREGAKFRTDAIKYFERYFQDPVKVPLMSDFYRGYPNRPLFSDWLIYSMLGSLYEKEYMFEKAIHCYKQLIIADKGTNSADYTRIGDVLCKISIDECVLYYKNLLQEHHSSDFKRTFNIKYNEALEKQANHYVYKKRKKK